MRRITTALAVAVTAVSLHGQQPASAGRAPEQDGNFRFRSGIELINVTATVSDLQGRFVAGLRQEDFLVYEDDQLQAVTHFSAERVPVSLGIALDTSQSMSGEKIREARSAIDRLLEALAAPQDEFFLYRFSNRPMLIQEWTGERNAISRALADVTPAGRTAMYDAIMDAIPQAQQGRNQKKALVVISDGNDTFSQHTLADARLRIRESEALVYAIGVDCDGRDARAIPATAAPRARAATNALSVSTRRRPRTSELAAADRSGTPLWPPGLPALRRSGRQRGTARPHRRQRRSHRDHSRPPRSESGDDARRRRAEQAGTIWVIRPAERKTAGGTLSVSKSAITAIAFALVAATPRAEVPGTGGSARRLHPLTIDVCPRR